MRSELPSAEFSNSDKQLNVYYPLGSIEDSEYMRSYIIDNLRVENQERVNNMSYRDLRARYMKIVRYKHVSRGGSAGVMTCSDDPEYTEFDSSIYSGRVYYGGLGLIYNINSLCENSSIISIDIVERSDDIIDLLSSSMPDDPRINITCGDPLRDIPRNDYNFMIWSQYQKWLYNIDGSTLQQQYLRLKHSNENM
jgi:hypothetical protein